MAMKIGNHSRIDKISAEDFALFSDETGVSLKAIASELGTQRDTLTTGLDRVTEMIADEVPEHLLTANHLREHFLRELEQRVEL